MKNTPFLWILLFSLLQNLYSQDINFQDIQRTCRDYKSYFNYDVKKIKEERDLLSWINYPEVISFIESHREFYAHKKQRELMRKIKAQDSR